MSILLLAVLFVFLFLIHTGAIVLVLGPLTILKPTRRRPEWYARFTTLLQPTDAGLPQETLWMTTPDGVALHTWFIPQKERARGNVIYLHGVGDCKIGGIALARFFYTLGFNVLMYDQRRHGESGGEFCTYGYYEKHDVSVAVDFLENRDESRGLPVAIFGTSMGAAIGIQAAAIEPRVRAIVSEASFTTLRDIITDYQKRILKLPWHFLRNAALARTQQLARFRGIHVSPIDDVQTLTIPILFLHGTEDTFIRCDYSRQLFQVANEPKRLVLIEGADHNDIWDVGGKKYLDAISTFLDASIQSSFVRTSP